MLLGFYIGGAFVWFAWTYWNQNSGLVESVLAGVAWPAIFVAALYVNYVPTGWYSFKKIRRRIYNTGAR